MIFKKEYDFESRNSDNYLNQRRIPFAIIFRSLLSIQLVRMGIFSFLFGLPFLFSFVSFSDLFSSSFNNDDPMVVGVITESIVTNALEGSDTIFEYKYQYKLPDGMLYAGTGYSTGNTKKTGDEIRILYKQRNPAKSKAVDLRNSLFGIVGGIIGFSFPVMGLIMLFFGTRKTIRQILILKNGDIAEGKLVSRAETNVKIDQKTVYALTFEFIASNNKTYQVVAKSNDYYELVDDAKEKLVYKSEKPENFVLVDDLPQGIRNYFLKMIKSR